MNNPENITQKLTEGQIKEWIDTKKEPAILRQNNRARESRTKLEKMLKDHNELDL